jgi:hypothetical protein
VMVLPIFQELHRLEMVSYYGFSQWQTSLKNKSKAKMAVILIYAVWVECCVCVCVCLCVCVCAPLCGFCICIRYTLFTCLLPHTHTHIHARVYRSPSSSRLWSPRRSTTRKPTRTRRRTRRRTSATKHFTTMCSPFPICTSC